MAYDIGPAPMRVDDLALHIGKQIRNRRRMLDMSQTELGRRCGVSFQTIHKYEVGAVNIAAAGLYGLARALGVSGDYFFEGVGRMAERRGAFGGAACP